MRILLVEDSARLRDLLADCLSSAGYITDAVSTAADFQELACRVRHSLYVIDLGLPDRDGIELIKDVRSQASSVPILVITGRVSIHERVRGLDSGADDYLVKPFNHAEFLARVRALLRRPAIIAIRELRAGHVKLNADTGEAFCREHRIPLRPSEARLLRLLAQRQGQIVHRRSIESTIFQLENLSSENALDQLVSRLRKVLSGYSAGIAIRTVKGAGYILELEI
jgi:DNA-binding response OmpR family regulator